METNLQTIKLLAQERQDENDRFRSFLKGKDGAKIDERVQRLNKAVEVSIDCTACGNCCKSFMISIEKEELDNVANFLQTPVETIKEKYIEESEGGAMLISAIPCHFLGGTKCTVYEARFSVCREFPHLHQPDFICRLFNVMQHYSICPIVFNVVETLKDELKFIDRNKC